MSEVLQQADYYLIASGISAIAILIYGAYLMHHKENELIKELETKWKRG